MRLPVFSVLILCLLTVTISAQIKTAAPVKVTAKIDERIELTSIVARLAGYEEYIHNEFKTYADDVDRHFGPFKNHPAVEFARVVREKNGIGFDAVPSLAVHLSPAPKLTPRVAFTASVPDKRWGKADAEKFAKLLKDFYRDAACAEFFKSHEAMYRTAESRMQRIVDQVDFSWYAKFYGEMPKGSFNLFIGLLNGGGNFGPKVVLPDGREELFSVMGTWQTETDGLPKYSEGALPTVIHEFNHSFINHLISARSAALAKPGEKIFPLVQDPMRKLAYGTWDVTVMESLVRAAVVRYLFDHNVNIEYFKGTSAAEVPYKIIELETTKGFYWIGDLVMLLGTYENSRKQYPTFRSFMPMIEAYFQELPKRIDYRVGGFERNRPTVTKILEFENGAKDVDPNLKTITFVFSKPMTGRGYSLNFGSLGQTGFPEVEKVIGYGDGDTNFKLAVKLKPGTDYELIVTGNSFASKDGFPLKDLIVRFSTTK